MKRKQKKEGENDCVDISALAQAQNLLYELNKDLEAIRELPLNTDPTFEVSYSEICDCVMVVWILSFNI